MSENNLPPENLAPAPRRRHHRSFFWPFLLIALGILLLLSNLGILDWSTWNMLWRFWPLVLVAVGIDVLIGGRSTAGTIVSAFLILVLIGLAAGAVYYADRLPVLDRLSADTSWQRSHVEQALDDYEFASVYIDWTSQPGYLDVLQDSDNLLEGDLTYQGELVFEVDPKGSGADIQLDTRLINNWVSFPSSPGANADWEVYLTPEIPLDLSLDTGSGSCHFDLSELTLEGLFLDSGSGSVQISLPEGQSYQVRISSGSGSLQVDVPESSGIRVVLDSGSGSFNPGSGFSLVTGEQHGDGVWESRNYDSARDTIEITIDQGSGSINFR
jgi:hypothetical protein